MNTYYMPGTMLNDLYVLNHFNPLPSLWGKYCFDPHFSDEETKAL